MNLVIGVFMKMDYNIFIGSRHMEVLRVQSGVRWAIG
jgi:hypothetical protein